MKNCLALTAVLAATFAGGPLAAQHARAVSLDLGLGVEQGPRYSGADDGGTSPWIILRRGGGQGEGLTISPSFGLKGKRDEGDGPLLSGLEPIDAAGEIGARIGYRTGPVAGYVTLRRGFGGHEGLTGAVGLRYHTELSDTISLTSGVQAVYGNARYNQTYYGVTEAESEAGGLSAYQPGSGFNEAAITFEARYALSDSTAILGEVRYGKLIGDAADSPIVAETYQPSLRLGVVRRFSFGF
ncbi:MipA/OmpV family protein [Paracoccus sp. (in: a-proteobacteria)]|uniref:MipA/OmpV family protein n=1 Tax=Paracoccus sp. TaxID=267 RepID=UPI002729DE15|nr:MipA/OmpV family protein [Paracoccus sp. (in: a-proteobacteria)]